jgi:hypothetical protein
MEPETRYAKSGGLRIAYQVIGAGPDLVMVPGLTSHLEVQWRDPGYRRFVRSLSSFCRLVRFDKPGTGLSDPVAGPPTLAPAAPVSYPSGARTPAELVPSGITERVDNCGQALHRKRRVPSRGDLYLSPMAHVTPRGPWPDDLIHWSKPVRTDVCSMFARMLRYAPAASGIRSATRMRATGQNGSSRHVLVLFVSSSTRINEQTSGLLIRGFGVRVPGGAPMWSSRFGLFPLERDSQVRYEEGRGPSRPDHGAVTPEADGLAVGRVEGTFPA